MIAQNMLRSLRVGAAKLELLFQSTNKASQTQYVLAPKDTEIDIQPVEDNTWTDSWRLEFPNDIDFPASHASSSSLPSASSSSSWGRHLYAGCTNSPFFYSQPEFRLGSTTLADISRSVATDNDTNDVQMSDEATQFSPSFQVSAQLGPAPLFVGTMWMPVLLPMTFSNITLPTDFAAAEIGSSMQHDPVVSRASRHTESSEQTKSTTQARTRKQRGAKRNSIVEQKAQDFSAVEEVHESQISAPMLRRTSSETDSSGSSPDSTDPCQTSHRLSSPSSVSSTPPTSDSRIESWADALDSDDDSCPNISHDVNGIRATCISSPSDGEVDPMLLDLDCGDELKRQAAIEWVIGSVYPLAVTRRGCRIVQRALEVASSADQQRIAEKLQGHVRDMLKSPNANHVLQKCIEVMTPEKMQFVIEELQGEAGFAARHRFGCRILQRLFEHCLPAQTEELINEILEEAPKLVRHQYGNFVIQHILQHGSPDQLHQIAQVLHTDVIRLAKHRIASHVVSCAMVHCSPEDVQGLTQVVLGEAGQLADLSRRQYGSFVVREVHRATRLHNQANA